MDSTFSQLRKRLNLRDEFFTERAMRALQKQFQTYHDEILKTRSFTVTVADNNDVLALVAAIQIVMPKINKDMRLTFSDKRGVQHCEVINKNSYGFLQDLFDDIYDNEDCVINDSDGPGILYRNLADYIREIKIDFVSRNLSGKRSGGYFPYWNLSDVDLSRFGIFKNERRSEIYVSSNNIPFESHSKDHHKTSFCQPHDKSAICPSESNINESCFITAIRESLKMLDPRFQSSKLALLKSVIQTRHVLKEDVKYIVELLDIDIKITHRKIDKKLKDSDGGTKIYSKVAEGDVKGFSVKQHNESCFKTKDKLLLNIMLFTIFDEFEHYTFVPSESDLKDISKVIFNKEVKTNLSMIIREMFKNNLFEPMNEDVKRNLDFNSGSLICSTSKNVLSKEPKMSDS